MVFLQNAVNVPLREEGRSAWPHYDIRTARLCCETVFFGWQRQWAVCGSRAGQNGLGAWTCRPMLKNTIPWQYLAAVSRYGITAHGSASKREQCGHLAWHRSPPCAVMISLQHSACWRASPMPPQCQANTRAILQIWCAIAARGFFTKVLVCVHISLMCFWLWIPAGVAHIRWMASYQRTVSCLADASTRSTMVRQFSG